MSGFVTHSTLTCPHCDHESKNQMPTDACMWFHYCEGCDAQLSPKKGDCCVYCSYGDVKCPPIQLGEQCGAG